MKMAMSNSPVITLNVGGTRFSTSKETLTWVSDSFFSSLLSGRISSYQDDQGAIFIDRDPDLFRIILNFLRTRDVDIHNVNVKSLKREAEFFGIGPLVARLTVCDELEQSSCGTVLFHGMLEKPTLPNLALSPRIERSVSSAHPPSQMLVGSSAGPGGDSNRVLVITGHNSWIAVAYYHSVICYKVKESCGWQQVFISPYLSECVERAAINAKVQGMAPDSKTRMIAVAFATSIRLWSFQDEQNYTEIGTFDMSCRIDTLFFIGSQLVATGTKQSGMQGRVGVWNAVSQHWQAQDVVQITSHDTAGAFLLLGGVNGAVYYIDMQKFPLRLKDNDLLITDLYRDPSGQAITALSVYLTTKNNITAGNWIEVAYGTASGAVCVIVQHPELVGQGFQLFQTFTVHRSPVTKVMLSEKHLVSVCADNNHVRTWTVTRFRGMISTQPGSMPLASFKVLALEPPQASASYAVGNNIGPYGDREEIQVFVQKVLPHCDILYIRLSSSGRRIAQVKSVDGSAITCFCLHECEGSSRMGSRPRRYLFTGHSNGAIQIWDMTTALDLSTSSKDEKELKYGPTQQELLDLLDQCDLIVSSHSATPSGTGASTPVTDILGQMLLRSSNTSLASTASVLALHPQCEGDNDPCTFRQSSSSMTKPQPSSPPPLTAPSSSNNSEAKRRHSQVLAASVDHASGHRRNHSVSALTTNLASNSGTAVAHPGRVPLPGLTPEVSGLAADRKESFKLSAPDDKLLFFSRKTSVRDRRSWAQEGPRPAGTSATPTSPRSPTETSGRRPFSGYGDASCGSGSVPPRHQNGGCSRTQSFSFKNRNNSNSKSFEDQTEV